MSRSRASTLQGPPVPAHLDPLKIGLTTGDDDRDGHGGQDVFASKENEELEHELGVPDSFEELPIEIRSLTERYALRPAQKLYQH